ncbi:TPA: hypothetical protein N0F65_002721 [Lagenidium giganteum]|uniref:Cytochrome P450 n=1 Tax=Lagenidium giganteum TaxID=4803 RepID=A0AAV2YZH2_9STRA|nr:TPA: hypothetical protein N0F65_002721 [Lagenidium giganteum]
MPTELLHALLLPSALLALVYVAWWVLFVLPVPYRLEQQEPSSTSDGQSHVRKVPLHQPASTLWLLGNTLDANTFQKDRYHDWLKEESERARWRPWLLTMLGEKPAIVLSTPEAFADVIQKQHDVFEKGPAKWELVRDFLGDGITAADGEIWRLQRKRISHLLLAPAALPFMAEVVSRQTRKLCAVVDTLMNEQRSFSLKKLFSSLTSDIFGEIGFGIDLGGMTAFASSDPNHPFLSSLVKVGKMLQARTQQPYWLWKLKRTLGVGVEKTGRQSLNVMHGIVNDVILKSMAREHGPERKDFLSQIVWMSREVVNKY